MPRSSPDRGHPVGAFLPTSILSLLRQDKAFAALLLPGVLSEIAGIPDQRSGIVDFFGPSFLKFVAPGPLAEGSGPGSASRAAVEQPVTYLAFAAFWREILKLISPT